MRDFNSPSAGSLGNSLFLRIRQPLLPLRVVKQRQLADFFQQ
jgi:hypothetical protein